MIKVVTSVTVFQDSVGMRESIVYSEIDEQTGKIISDNRRENRVLTDASIKSTAATLIEDAESYIGGESE